LTEQEGGEPDIVVHSLSVQNWNLQWAQAVKPLRIGQRMVIRPSWETVECDSRQIELILDPKRAFGTGHHPTTHLLLEWLEDEIRGGESVLDVGTGSGLLSMAALRLGARRAVGLDHDPDAIECAQEYAALNRFGPELSLECRSLAGDPPHDLVLANLDCRTLLNLVQSLAASTGGRLLASGLLLDQRDEIVEAFARAGLYAAREREREGWLAVKFLKAESCEGA
jgi:ribosomal protein L11 methyltransferase